MGYAARQGRDKRPTKRLREALARFAHERDRLGEDDPDRVADLHGLLVRSALEVEAGNRGDRQLDREADRVVGEGDLLRSLHLLGESAELAPELVGVAKRVELLVHRDEV